MGQLSERHEVRMRAPDSTIVFVADSEDGRLQIRQERDGGSAEEVCSITLANPDELRAFFKGLRAIAASLGQEAQVRAASEAPAEVDARTRTRAAVNDRFNEEPGSRH